MHKVLSLDGGGVRGIVSIAFLLRLEKLLEEQTGGEIRLCDCFDLIGGTSTGAIIATALATGKTANEIKDFYFDLAPKVFKRSRFRLLGFQHVFDGNILREEIRQVLGDVTLESDTLKTGLAIMTKRVDTGSAWIVTNNRNARFWDDPVDGSYIGNRHMALVDLVRASTAAPHFFAPEMIKIVEGMPQGLFVDGGVTPHNNPSLALFQLVGIPEFGYGWQLGAENLSILSIGTGFFRQTLHTATARVLPAIILAMKGLTGLIHDCDQNVLTTMQMLGRSPDPVHINSEIGALKTPPTLPEPLLAYQRYNIEIDPKWLAEVLNLSFSKQDVLNLQKMDNPEIVPALFEIATRAADELIKPGHINQFLHMNRPEGEI